MGQEALGPVALWSRRPSRWIYCAQDLVETSSCRIFHIVDQME